MWKRLIFHFFHFSSVSNSGIFSSIMTSHAITYACSPSFLLCCHHKKEHKDRHANLLVCIHLFMYCFESKIINTVSVTTMLADRVTKKRFLPFYRESSWAATCWSFISNTWQRYNQFIMQSRWRHTWKSVQHRFRRVSHRRYLTRVRNYVGRHGTKKQKVDDIETFIYEWFEAARESCLPAHDFDLKRWPL